MTLTEYLNQEDPKRHPKVILEKSEYQALHPITVAGVKHTVIEIPKLFKHFPDSSPFYVKVGDKPCLYTQDKDGNPKSLSCFYIKHEL